MRRPKDHTLAIALAVAFRLDAILAYRSLLATLDAAFATSQTSGFGSFAGEFGPESRLCLAGVSAVHGDIVVAVIVGRVVSSVGVHLAEVSFVGERVVGRGSACFGRVPSEVLGKANVCPSAWLGVLLVQEEVVSADGGTGPMQSRSDSVPMVLMQRRTAWGGVELSKCKSQWQGCLLLIADLKMTEVRQAGTEPRAQTARP
jgi:hypothetical protein